MSLPTPLPSYISRNGLAIAYTVLKTKLDRFLDNTHMSPLEDFYEKVGRANGLAANQYTLSNSEVEQFYTDQTSETNFIATAESRLVRAAISPAGSPVSLNNFCPLGNGTTVSTGQPGLTFPEVKLLTVIWDMYSMISDISPVASKIPRVCGLCLWQMFLCLDKDGLKQVAVEDVYQLVNLIFKFSGQSVDLETVQEWFCDERKVDFRCFLQSLVEAYAGLLQENAIQDLYTKLCLKQLKQGKLMKKGHVVHSWKSRWFILTTSDLRYYETQESPTPKGCISITADSQVQTMSDTRGHPYKFRVTDGMNRTATEISCPDDKARRDWMDAIRLAMRLNSTEGRNFVHCYSQALESGPKINRGMVLKTLKDGTTVSSPTTSPTHKALASSKSVPLDVAAPKREVGRKKQRYPMTPQEELHRPLVPQSYSLDELEEENDAGHDEPPPLPPQRLDSGDIRNLKLSRPALAEYDIQGSGRSQRSPRISLRRTSSAGDLEESIKHLQVGEEEYALVSKVPKKKQEKKVSAPPVLQEILKQQKISRNAAAAAANGHQRSAAPPPISKKRSPPMPRKKSPPLPFQKRKSQEDSFDERDVGVTTSRSRQQPLLPPSGPSYGPPPDPPPKSAGGNMSYAQLNFSPGAGGEFVDDGAASSSRVPAGTEGEHGDGSSGAGIPHDPKTKYGYSTILFDEAKQKDIIAAERLKKERGAPPPIPDKYQGGGNKAKKLRQYVSDSSAMMASSLAPNSSSKDQRFQGKARPISAGTSRTPAAGHGARGALNGINSANNSSASYGDYEVMDDEFYDEGEEEEEFENVPRKPKSTNGAGKGGSHVTPPPVPNRQPASNSGYEIVELESNFNDRGQGGQGRSTPGGGGGVVDRQNQPLPPVPPSREQQSSPNPRPQHLLAKSLQQNGGGAPPQPKPRASPRKYVTTPNQHMPPVPPRKIS